jgi:hypothetical protein
MRFTIVVLILAGTSATANTEIHSCLLDDGTIAFQQKPCSEPAVNVDDSSEVGESRNANETPAADDDVFDFVKPFDQPATPRESRNANETPAADDDVFDFVKPFDQPATPPTPSETKLPEPVLQDRAECEKTTRDAIDAIDFEMRETPYTKEQGEEYLAELLALTQQLRACKQL